jgi:monoterpene epsilon-lactone hydrolase
MASEQSLANKAHYEQLAAAVAKGPLTPEQQIEWNEVHWPMLTAEPRGVDYVEVDATGIPAMWIIPKGSVEDRAIFYAHGGGFVSGSIYTHRKMVGHLAKAVGCRALTFDYPYAYQQKYPAQLDVTVACYRWLLRDQGVSAEHVAAAGDSCGAILIFGMLQQVRREALPLPVAVMVLSGWLDMTLTGASYETNRQKDVFFTREGAEWLVANFLGNGDRRDPLVNALYADLKGFPPIFLQAGADEALLDDTRMLAQRATAAGVDARIEIFPEMLHTFQMMAGAAPEADDAIDRFAQWVRPKLGLPVLDQDVA